MTLNGVNYYYIKNAQGDVVRICDESGNIVITYNYDAWGNLVNFSGSVVLFLANPFRYRGYYYDLETGFYYLNSRYYDPVVGRWISPEPNVDNGEFDESAGLLGYNVYVYCANNPVNLFDPTGEFVAAATLGGGLLIKGAVVGGANFWNPDGWVVLGVVVVGGGIWAGVTIYNNRKAKQATISKINQGNMNKTVKEILKGKKGSIKNAKLPKGSPSWDDIIRWGLTLEEIYRRAERGDPGFATFKKLLTDGRFNK